MYDDYGYSDYGYSDYGHHDHHDHGFGDDFWFWMWMSDGRRRPVSDKETRTALWVLLGVGVLAYLMTRSGPALVPPASVQTVLAPTPPPAVSGIGHYRGV